MALRVWTVLAVAAAAACGDDPTEPVLSGQGFVVSVSIPGVTDTTLQGDSLYWRFFSGPDAVLGRRRELILSFLLLDPPPPLLSPLVLETRWYHVGTPLPDQGSYELTGDASGGVYLQATSNVGSWASSAGQVRLSEVTDAILRGDITATLTQIYPPGSSLPDVTLQAQFWAPRTTDLATDDSHHN